MAIYIHTAILAFCEGYVWFFILWMEDEKEEVIAAAAFFACFFFAAFAWGTSVRILSTFAGFFVRRIVRHVVYPGAINVARYWFFPPPNLPSWMVPIVLPISAVYGMICLTYHIGGCLFVSSILWSKLTRIDAGPPRSFEEWSNQWTQLGLPRSFQEWKEEFDSFIDRYSITRWAFRRDNNNNGMNGNDNGNENNTDDNGNENNNIHTNDNRICIVFVAVVLLQLLVKNNIFSSEDPYDYGL
mmetsp:Transcript_17918/g.43478  ORF Transcript_17918/g.43478 Transcript_17918/m.43478 type:complete len:242 (+) Transcript_17918:304-1029(+)